MFAYIWESSRSSYQRAKEHMSEVQRRKKTHPLVELFDEHHQGQWKEVLFWVLGHFRTPLERQVWESVRIDHCTATLGVEGYLNYITEWRSSKALALVPKTT